MSPRHFHFELIVNPFRGYLRGHCDILGALSRLKMDPSYMSMLEAFE
jgi:hypothetical protein